MAFWSLGRARWLALSLTLAACGNRDETHLLLSAGPAPVVNPVRPEPTDSEPLPVVVPTSDAGVDAAAPQGPGAVSVEDAGGVASPGDAGAVEPPEPPPVPAPLCSRLGPTSTLVLDEPINEIVFAPLDDCRTGELSVVFEDETTLVAWANYLFDYTVALLGCPDAEPPPGGLDVFPLSNTGVEGVDLPPPAIGSDDAEVLIEQYLNALSGPLALTPAERAEFEAYLRYQADKVVDPEVSGALSTCAP